MKLSKKHVVGAFIVSIGMSAQLVNAYQPQPYGPMYHGGYYNNAPMQRPYMKPGYMYGAQQYPRMHSNHTYSYNTGHSDAQKQSTSAQSEQTASNAASITIGQMRFEPSIVTVKKGAKVTWEQKESMPHTVTANDKSFASQQLGMNDQFTQTFDDPGVYTYYCSLHPSMQGVVRVVE